MNVHMYEYIGAVMTMYIKFGPLRVQGGGAGKGGQFSAARRSVSLFLYIILT